MRSRARAAIAAVLLLASAACDAPPPAPPAVAAPPPPKPPAYTASGIEEERDRLERLDLKVRRSRFGGDLDRSRAAVAEWLAAFPARWAEKEVPVQESMTYARILQRCGRPAAAVAQARRSLEWLPAGAPERVRSLLVLVPCLVDSGDLDGALGVLEAQAAVIPKVGAERSFLLRPFADAPVPAGSLGRAATLFGALAVSDTGDVDAAALAVDFHLRLGRPDEASRVAGETAAVLEKRKPRGWQGRVVRARDMEGMAALVGKPAPGFGAARWWKGAGGPVPDDSLSGRVTVVFTWSMGQDGVRPYFERLHALAKDYEGRGVRVVGISRLERFNPRLMAADADMTEERDLEFHDAWVRENRVSLPLAVGGHGDDALAAAWAARVVPLQSVVGRDGNVAYLRAGQDEGHFAVLRSMIDAALAR